MKKIWLYLALVALAVSSCAPVYVPNARNAPLFRGAGEFQGSVNFSQGIDAQAAVSVTDHLGLMANYNYTNRTSTEDNDDYIKHRFFEGALATTQTQATSATKYSADMERARAPTSTTTISHSHPILFRQRAHTSATLYSRHWVRTTGFSTGHSPPVSQWSISIHSKKMAWWCRPPTAIRFSSSNPRSLAK